MQANIAIVVVGFNRPAALSRLLSSIQKANYKGYQNIPLIISLDYSGSNECTTIAHNFQWPYGSKQVIAHKQNLGLKAHILQCGELSKQYEGIIVLEDDLFVSPAFYDYAWQAYHFYKNDTQIAGIGLYNYPFNEIAYCPFEPIADGFDNYFMQVPCSWGQLWTREQWQLFYQYISGDASSTGHLLPPAVQAWPTASSWKKLYYQYLIHSNRYFVYPRTSLTTNYGDIGQHHSNETMVWQTALLLNNMTFRFSKLDTATSVYDAYFEISPEVYNRFSNQQLDVCIDLNGSKPLQQIKSKYLISSKQCKNPQKRYDINLYPYEKNILLHLENTNHSKAFFSFGLTKDFDNNLNVDRRYIDINRRFLSIEFIIDKGRNEIKKTHSYKIGNYILMPILLLKKKFKLIKRKPQNNE